MKKIFLSALVTALFFSYGNSQTPSPKGKDGMGLSFSLKQCIDYALQNQTSVKNALLDEAIAKDKVREVTGIGLPQINANVQFVNNDPLRRMFGVGDGGPNFFAGGKFIPKGEVFAVPNIFQLKAGGDAGLTLTQLIFSSSYFVGLQAAKTYKELSSKATIQTKIEFTEAVSKSYYLVLINQERIKLFDKIVARLDTLLFQAKAMNQNGLVEKIDVDRLQVAYNNLQTEREKFKNMLELSMALLKFQMSMPLENELTLTEKISDFKAEAPPVQKMDYKNRIEFSLLESQKKLQQLDIKNNNLSHLPRVAAFANAGWFSQSPEFNYFTKSNLWYNYGMYGINISIPIFDGMQTSYKNQQSKLKSQQIENNIQSFELAASLQVKSAEISLKNNLSSLESQSKNMELADEVAKVTKTKYRAGVGTSLEVTTAETALLEAQTNYYNALYDALISKVDYDKANGTLITK
jgi:outer membrane protein